MSGWTPIQILAVVLGILWIVFLWLIIIGRIMGDWKIWRRFISHIVNKISDILPFNDNNNQNYDTSNQNKKPDSLSVIKELEKNNNDKKT